MRFYLFEEGNIWLWQLLSILGIGFAQGMYALDAADGVTGMSPRLFYCIPSQRYSMQTTG
jgi:hypothetical protein